jgi:hypothetical protein
VERSRGKADFLTSATRFRSEVFAEQLSRQRTENLCGLAEFVGQGASIEVILGRFLTPMNGTEQE